MVKQLLILSLFVVLDLFWWQWADARVRRFKQSWGWRGVLALFIVTQIAYVLWNLWGTSSGTISDPWPMVLADAAYIWHLLVLPTVCAFICGAWFLKKWGDRTRPRDLAPKSPEGTSQATAKTSRREVLRAAAIALPPLAMAVATGFALEQTGEFRVRRIELYIPQLPGDLDGITIAHVTDLHLGRFVPPALIGPIADAVNALSCDLIAFTGDLMDVSLPHPATGMDFLRRLRPGNRLVMIEGNHDVMLNADRFEGELRNAGFPLLLDEAATIRLPGRTTPVQFLGMSWGDLIPGSKLHKIGRARHYNFREPSDEARAASIRQLLGLRDPGAFPILLAHHPHAFDPAAAAGFPLILSGHTHGGQLMLTPRIGIGPLRFRYWSGLYRKPNSQLFISNGVGSWFPMRVNAPAEIVHLTLRRASVTLV